MQKRVKRIVFGSGRKAARARGLYRRIASGAGQQQRLQGLYERRFFDPKFESMQLAEEAEKFGGSRRQQIELREYAKRLAGKRNWQLNRFKAWGLKAGDMGKPMERTPSGTSAKKILFNQTKWHNIGARVEMVPIINLIGFVVGREAYNDIIKKEFPKIGRTPAFFLPGNPGTIDAMISPNLKELRECFLHEKIHAIVGETPLTGELYSGKKQRFNPRNLTQSFAATNLRLGARSLGRGLLDELIASTFEKKLGYFEGKYRHHYLGDYVMETLGPKTAAAFMRNKGGYKQRLLKATAQSIKAVRKALAATATDSQGRKRKVISREQLAGLLINIRDIEKVPKRLPVLVELGKRAMEKRRRR